MFEDHFNSTVAALTQTTFLGLRLDEKHQRTLEDIGSHGPSYAGYGFLPITLDVRQHDFPLIINELYPKKQPDLDHRSVFDIFKDSPERNVCAFWPEPWLDDLRAAGIRVFNIDYNLYSRLNYNLN